MSFRHDSDAPLGGIGKNVGKLDLSARVEVEFRVLRGRRVGLGWLLSRRRARVNLRNAETDVRDTNQIVRVAVSSINEQLNCHVIDPMRKHVPSEANALEVTFQILVMCAIFLLPREDQTGDVVLESPQEGRANRRDGVRLDGFPRSPGK